MSNLKLKVTNNGNDVGHIIKADFNIASIFSRLESYHCSDLLEQSHECGILVHLLHDICGNLTSFPTTGNLFESQGQDGSSREVEAIASAGASRIFCIQLLSGVIGVLQLNYLPTGAMTAGDFSFEKYK